MKFNNLKALSEEQFRRVTGVKRATFNKMVEIVTEAEKKKKTRGGRPNNLSIENRILMTLEYLREYRTYLHIGTSYGLAESNAYQNIRWIEDVLIKSKEFRLPGKKALQKSDMEFEIILIDATETPIERPKKSSADFTRARKKDTQSKGNLLKCVPVVFYFPAPDIAWHRTFALLF